MKQNLKYAVWFRKTDPKTKKVIDYGIVVVSRDQETAEWHKKAYEMSPNRSKDIEYLIIPKHE